MKITKILVASVLMLAVEYQIYAMDEEKFALFQDEEDQADEKGTFDLLEDELELAHANITNAVQAAGRWLRDRTYQTLYGPDQGLFSAVEYNRIADVQAILARGVNPDIQNQHGYTALMMAAYDGQQAIAEALLAAGANPNIQDQYGYTALMQTAYYGQQAIAEALLAAGANPNIQNQHGYTALMQTAYYGQQAIAEALLAAGANPNIQDENGYTALMETAYYGQPAIAEAILATGVADINLRNRHNYTALLSAIAHGNIPMAIYLIEHGAEYTQEDQDNVATNQRFNYVPQEVKDQVFDAWQASQNEYVLK